MGRLIDGDWRTDEELDESDRERDPTTFRETIGSSAFPADPTRYHLYVSRACPWAHGVIVVRKLLGLEDELTMDVVDPHRRTDGWEFAPEKPGCTPDTENGSSYLRSVYTAADPSYTGRVSVPVLWDTETETIVNNESIEIMRTFADAFGDRADVDLYPEELRDEIDSTADDLYRTVNTGVYRAGFAKTQSAYANATTELFDALDRWERTLEDQRFLVGEQLTLADLRLFATLVRFDAVYHTHFKCNVRSLIEYENLWGFTRDVYQLPGIASTVNEEHIKEHYYRSHTDINPTGFVPVGPDRAFTAPHDRDSLAGSSGIQ
ncbi:glutathione S-transferase family protein [Natronobiforma cellulositropha]|uniref:glutathione S-transferase family protein n=1 Tax=Natronobiforma cellulositropha TaxID=1679076 RepID=UPI0021D61033|nr:glutathione S-transferase family protein [Natronobiforma cellulositropha]